MESHSRRSDDDYDGASGASASAGAITLKTQFAARVQIVAAVHAKFVECSPSSERCSKSYQCE